MKIATMLQLFAMVAFWAMLYPLVFSSNSASSAGIRHYVQKPAYIAAFLVVAALPMLIQIGTGAGLDSVLRSLNSVPGGPSMSSLAYVSFVLASLAGSSAFFALGLGMVLNKVVGDALDSIPVKEKAPQVSTAAD